MLTTCNPNRLWQKFFDTRLIYLNKITQWRTWISNNVNPNLLMTKVANSIQSCCAQASIFHPMSHSLEEEFGQYTWCTMIRLTRRFTTFHQALWIELWKCHINLHDINVPGLFIHQNLKLSFKYNTISCYSSWTGKETDQWSLLLITHT